MMYFRVARVCLLLSVCLLKAPCFADEFEYVAEDGSRVTLQARLIGSGQGFQALERTDGQIALVPSAAILSRENSGDPAPVDCDEMASRLKQIFSEELTRVQIQEPFVVAMVLTAPLERNAEGHAATFLKKAARFMTNVNGVFEKYAESMNFPLRDFRYPIVLLIFESDDDFDRYANDATGGRGLSASSITGFYSGLTNWLAVRMSACDSFEVPLHEAIHQQMYNRVLQRLSLIPKWFDEGIATGFEGSGERIRTNPALVNPNYARRVAQLPRGIRWSSLAGDDAAFNADVVAGDAYTLAWCLHWMLATSYEDQYQAYVRKLAERPPLKRYSPEEDRELFESTLGVNMDQLQRQFPQALQQAARRQHVKLSDPPPGRAFSQQALGQYNIEAIRITNLGGRMQVEGMLMNISPLRPMTFYVTVETGDGLYADWLVPDLKPRQKQKLHKQLASKRIPGAGGGSPASYQVFIRSVPADSREANNWKNGQIPGPVTAGD